VRAGVELLDHDVVLERFGGDVMSAEVSATQQLGLDALVEKVLLLAEILNLRANPQRSAEGVAVEARMERGVGPVATTIVQRGTLRVGDIVVAGAEWGRVRKLILNGQEVAEAPPGTPVDVLGLQGVPRAGDSLRVASSEQQAREIADVRSQREREERAAALFEAQADQKRGELFGELVRDDKKETVDVVIKADVQGSAEALRSAIEALQQTDSFGYSAKCRVLRADAGSLTLEDIQLASVSDALVIAFNVNPPAVTLTEAAKLGITVVKHSIVYDALDEVSARLSELVAPAPAKWLGIVTGRADVLQTFKIGKGVGMVAGCMVTEGQMKRGSNLRVVRGKQVMHEGSINELRYLKDEVEVVETGSECGISFETFDGVKQGDVIECYIGGGGDAGSED
jgi:translation initiation factor IF-2